MDEVVKLIPAVFRRHVGHGQAPVVEILDPLWTCVAGKTIAAHCRPVSFAAGRLTVRTGSRAWATQLCALKEELRATINSFLGAPVVKSIIVRHSPSAAEEKSAIATPPQAFPREETVRPVSAGNNLGEAGTKLPPQIAEVVSRSFARYFARPGGTSCR